MPTIIPMMMGTVYFALRSAFTMSVRNCVFCCVFYAAFASTYILTVSGVLNTRLVMLGLSGAFFVYIVFFKTRFFTALGGVSEVLPELSLLLVILSLFFETWEMRRGRLY